MLAEGIPAPDEDDIVLTMRDVLHREARAIEDVSAQVDRGAATVVRAILASRGKVVVTGVGKSGHIGAKIAATLTSTGTRSVFLHPTEAMHGDVGALSPDDIVLAISKSGETNELLLLLPIIRSIGSTLVAIVGNRESTLARKADHVLSCRVDREACPHDLAPTSSTTAALALGDALAIALMKARGFTPSDFARFHPGGILGRRLLLSVRDLMHTGSRNPVISPDAALPTVVDRLTEYRLGAVNVVDEEGRLLGVITDGDIRRAIARGPAFFSMTAAEAMTRDPVVVRPEDSADEAYRKMEFRPSQINVLPVVDEQGRAIGILRLHDLVGGG